MNMRASLILLAIAVVLTAASAILAWQEETARRRAGRSQRLFPFTATAMRSAIILRGGRILAHLRREDDNNWRVSCAAGGASDLADSQAIREICAFVELASTARPAAPPPDRDPLLVRIGTGEAEVEVKIFLAARGAPSHVQRSGEQEAYEVADDLVRVFHREPSSFRSLDLFAWQGGEIDRIIVRIPPADETALTREGGAWFITQPLRWPADPQAIERFMLLCRMLRAEAIIADEGDNYANYGLNANPVEVRLGGGGHEQAVYFGSQTAEGGIYVRRLGSAAIYRAGRGLYDEITRNRENGQPPWYDRYRLRVLDLLAGITPAVIRIIQADETLVLQRAAGNQWSASGARSFAVEEQAVAFLLQTLANVQIANFISERAAEMNAYGLSPSAFRIICEDAGGNTFAAIDLSHPERTSGRLFAAVGGRPQIFELSLVANRGLLMPFVFYRSRHLPQFDHQRVATVTLVRGEERRVFRHLGRGHWQLLEPQTRLLEEDVTAFSMFIAKLSRLRCAAFFAEKTYDFSKFGLDPCRARVIVTFRHNEGGGTEEAWDLRLGASAPADLTSGSPAGAGSPVFARLANDAAVFLLDGRWLADVEREYR